MTYYLIYLSIAFFITNVMVFPIKKIAKNYNMVSSPEPLIPSRNREIPYLGGVALYLGFIITLIAFFYIKFPDQEINVSLANSKFVGIIIAAVIVTFSGLIHDVYPYTILLRISLQVISVFVLIAHGIITDISFLSLQTMTLGSHQVSIGNLFFTVFFTTLVINSFDFLDIFDGVLIHVVLVISSFLFLSAILGHQYENAFLLALLLGSLLGLFIDQTTPSKILLGKSGSYFLGLITTVILIEMDYSQNTLGFSLNFILLAFPIIAFLCLLFVPKQKIISFCFSKANEKKIVLYAVIYSCITGLLFFALVASL